MLSAPGRGTISSEHFRHFVGHELAADWARLRALSLHLRSLLPGEPPRALLAWTRAHARSGRFDALLPAPCGAWRSEAAELDLATLLAQLWILQRGPGTRPGSTEELACLLEAAWTRHAPQLEADPGPVLARCGDAMVLVRELWPDLSALMTPQQREALLERALEEFHFHPGRK